MSTQQPRKPYKNWPNDPIFQTESESRSPVELSIVGTFPPQVAGALYRTGPGQYKVDTESGDEYARSHWFDGFSQLHRFQIVPDSEGGCRVYYTSRGQMDELLEKARKGGNIDRVVTFGQRRDPCESVFRKVKTTFHPTAPGLDHPQMWSVAVTVARDVPGMPKGMLTNFTDANQIKQADMETLEPAGVLDQKTLHPDLKGPLSGAHPQYDQATGDMYSYNLDLGPWGTYRVFKTSAETSKTEILATISGPGTNAAYIHSFFMTKDYVILCVWPSYFTGFGASLLWERNVIDALKYHPQEDTKWYIIDRKGKRGHIATFTSPAFFSFHTVNAFQEDNPETGTVDIFCDIVQFPNDGVIHKMYYENIISTGSRAHDSEYDRPSLVRYKLPGVPKDKGKLQGKRLRAEVVTTVPHSAELPVINPLYATKKQRYVYGIVDRGYSSFIDGLAKMDFETGNITYWGREPKPHTPSEAIFVPDGTNESEDAGYLLSVVLDGEMGTSYLVCLNARDMMEVARAEHSQPIGYGIHGVHYGL